MIFFSYFISAKGLSESLRIFWISQVFPANKDRNTVVEHLLLSPFDARLIRFHPKTYRGYTSMRAEVYGCRKGGCWKFLKLVGSRFRRFSWPKKTTDVLLIVLLLQIELRESIKTSNKSFDSWHPCNVLRHVAGTKYPPNWCCTIIKVSVHTKGHAATKHYWDTYRIIFMCVKCCEFVTATCSRYTSLQHVAWACTTQVLSLQDVPATWPLVFSHLKTSFANFRSRPLTKSSNMAVQTSRSIHDLLAWHFHRETNDKKFVEV